MKKNTRSLVLSALFLALGVLIPYVTGHAFGLEGKIFLPMHWPILLAALFLSWPWALAVGVMTPLLSALLTGMPAVAPMPMLQIMLAELPVYALTASLMRWHVVHKAKSTWVQSIFSLIPAMVAGRAAAGLATALLAGPLGLKIPAATPWAYVWGATITGVPGLILQIVLIPALYFVFSTYVTTPQRGG